MRLTDCRRGNKKSLNILNQLEKKFLEEFSFFGLIFQEFVLTIKRTFGRLCKTVLRAILMRQRAPSLRLEKKKYYKSTGLLGKQLFFKLQGKPSSN
jgi:hypothetical protein